MEIQQADGVALASPALAAGSQQPKKDEMTESNDDDISGKTVSFLALKDAMSSGIDVDINEIDK